MVGRGIKVNSLKSKIKQNEVTYGSWITLGNTAIVEIMAEAGFDWLTIDMEHSSITLDQAQQMIQVMTLYGITPLVRVGNNDATIIKRVLDAGAHGVIVPMVNSKEDAIRAVKAAKYPPVGTRGVGLARAQGYGFEFDKYKEWAENESMVIVQIEHIQAIENLEEILDTPGVDASIIGPYDLSGSLGFPGEFERKEVKEALKRYEDICIEKKKTMGFHVVQPDINKTSEYRKMGYSLLAVGLDTLYLGHKCREVMNDLK